jgi:NADH:ubiquinone oxidoreductase subunit
MKNYKPLFDRLVVFSVPIRRRITGSVLYAGNAKRSSFNRAEEIWVLSNGPECREPLPRGTHAWLNDSFELEPTDLDLWSQHENDPEFARLKAFVQSVDGDVKTAIVKEAAILAVDDEYEATTVVKSMPKD